MLVRTALVTTAACLAAAGAAQPAAAKSKPPKSAKFSAVFVATYKTAWNEPRRLTGGSVCGGLNYQQGQGEESWTVKTRKPQKLIAFERSYGATFFHDTWDVDGDDGDGIAAFGVHKRSGDSFWSTDPGTCGGEYRREKPDPNGDCGTRLPEYVLRFDGLEKIRPAFSVAAHMRNEKLHFAACDIRYAEGLTSNVWPKVEQALPARRLFSRQRVVTVSGRKTWSNASEPNAKYWTTSSSLKWKLTLTRVKG